MKISREEISTVIRRVLTYYSRKKKLDGNIGTTLLIVPEYPVGFAEVIAEYELYGEFKAQDILMEFRDTEISDMDSFRMFYIDNREDISHILHALTHYQQLEIYAPSLDFLRNLKEGKEKDIFIRIALYFLMAGKPVIVRLPYDSHTLPEGKFGKAVRDLIDDLWDMGISFAGLMPRFEETVLEGEKKEELITENVIEAYHFRGYHQIYAVEAAVITPLAIERAKELNIQIIK